jgi:glycosidase
VYSKDHDGISLAEEEAAPNSLLKFYRRLVHMRLSHPALRGGYHGLVEHQELIDSGSPRVLAFSRVISNPSGVELPANSALVLANLSGDTVTVSRPEWPQSGDVDIWTGRKFGKQIRLAPYGFAIFEFKTYIQEGALSMPLGPSISL